MRKAFKAEHLSKAKQIKVRIKESESLSLDMSNDAIDRDLYTMLKISGTRISSLALKSDKQRYDRIVQLKHIVFLLSRKKRRCRVFVILPVTKTRSAVDPVGMMQEQNQNVNSDVCAVERLY